MVPMNVREATNTTQFTLPHWSPAEFLDMPYVDGFVLRALVCRLGGKWQWSIMSIEGDSDGKLISLGTAKTVADARRIAASELDKCIRDPFI
jgi:hypothetical protein